MNVLQSRWRLFLVVSILAVQLGGVLYARTNDARYLAWAPYDQVSEFEVSVVVDGVDLDPSTIVERYARLGLTSDDGVARGRDNRSIAHVHHLIRRLESGSTGVVVTVRTSVNGEPPEVWIWPS